MDTALSDACRRGAARLALRWPRIRAELGRRVKSDVGVAELCEAYEAAYVATEYWLHSQAQVAPARIEEYRMLVAATEREILEALS
jgi:hypothetical protein